jgi:hypothetical protein
MSICRAVVLNFLISVSSVISVVKYLVVKGLHIENQLRNNVAKWRKACKDRALALMPYIHQ